MRNQFAAVPMKLQYIVICDHAITADDVHIKWTTLMGSTEASEKDEIGLAHVSISKDGGSVQ